jgi:sarcosine oxidase subunit gamma
VSAAERLSPLAGRLLAGRHGAPGETAVRISERRGALVQLAARRGRVEALALAIQASFGLDLPPPNRAAAGAAVTALWLQPGAWLAIGPQMTEGGLARALLDACGTNGTVVDQTHGRVQATLSGASCRDVLARLCRLDLHPRSFGVGQTAATPVAELPCLLYRPSDADAFEIVVQATFAATFLHRLTEAASGFGYEIEA